MLNDNNGSCNDFGGGWFIIILFLFAMMGGWGNGWNRGGMGGASGAADNYVLASDFAQVERKLDTVNAGLCDGFYAMNTGMLNGFAGVAQQNSNIAMQLQQCCCDNKAAIADLKYTIAQGDYATSQAINMAARDIVDSQNANYRALHDEIMANRIEDKNAQIAAQQQQIFGLQLAASQTAQNAYLVDKLGYHCPQPAYVVQPPQQVAFATNCSGQATYAGGGCGCMG